MHSQESNILPLSFRLLLVAGVLILPTVLSANHGAEAIGILAPIGAALIGVVVFLILTLVFLFRKRRSPSAAYMLFVLNFGLGILLFGVANNLDVNFLFGVGGLHITLGVLVAIKTIKNPPNRS